MSLPRLDEAASSSLHPLEALLEELHSYFAWMLSRYRVPSQDREDVLAATLLAAVLRWSELEHPRRWLISTLRNQCRMYWRRQRRWQGETSVEAAVLERCAGSVTPAPWLRVDLERAIARLPPKRRRLLRACYVEGYEPSEAAVRCGYEASSGSAVLRRSRREVAARL